MGKVTNSDLSQLGAFRNYTHHFCFLWPRVQGVRALVHTELGHREARWKRSSLMGMPVTHAAPRLETGGLC